MGGYSENQQDRAAMAIDAAKGELLRRHLDPQFYRITLRRHEGAVIAVCADRETPIGARGVPAKHPTLEVELDANDLHVIRSYFAR